MLAVGRNLERLAELQRRLVETQQSVERDYLRLRHIEARYRVLFETSPEAVLMVDAHNYRLLEANIGAQALFKDAGKRLVGRDFRECFETESQGEVTVRLQNNGRIVNGVGSDPDIVVASAKAYISALNKLQSKAERVAAQG